jgi:hypothetical protein
MIGPMRNWIFQASPKRYDIFGALARGENIDRWSILQHIPDIRPGDRAALWVCGPHRAGVYGVGFVDGRPFDAAARRPWRTEYRGQRMTFCPIELELFGTDPIPATTLRNDTRFATARIVTQPFARNPFLTTDEEWEAIEDRLPA